MPTCSHCGGPHLEWECANPKPSRRALMKPPLKELTPAEFKAGYNAYMRAYMRKRRANNRQAQKVKE